MTTACTAKRNKDAWLAEPEHPEPAHYGPNPPAPQKVQALVDYATDRGFTVVSREEFDRIPGPKMTLAQYDRSLARKTGNRGHAPRSATNDRTKGSKRTAKRTTGSGTTSSGEDSDPELQPRRCEACGADISSLPKPARGPRPRYCHDPDCKRERARYRQRKRRGAQHVLVRWTEMRPLAGSERHVDDDIELRLSGMDGCDRSHLRERTYTIIDLPLALERQPDDTAGRWLDERADIWLGLPDARRSRKTPPELTAEERLVAAWVENRAMLRAGSAA